MEKQLLLKSHSEERTEAILEERYSWTGQQRPTLALINTEGNLEAQKRKSRAAARRAVKKTSKKLKIEPARTSLKKFLRDVRSGTVSIAYSDFESMNKLWKDYMNELAGNADYKGSEDVRIANILSKLPSADFHGAFLVVTKCTNPTNVGLCGIVIWEARNCFVLVTEQNKLKMVEKKGTVFEFSVPQIVGRKFEILGSRFLFRTADRSGRKFKVHSVEDL